MSEQKKISKIDLIDELDRMIENIERLPATAMMNSINHYDFASLLILLSAILRSDCKEES
jgi:hypothetical protein